MIIKALDTNTGNIVVSDGDTRTVLRPGEKVTAGTLATVDGEFEGDVVAVSPHSTWVGEEY